MQRIEAGKKKKNPSVRDNNGQKKRVLCSRKKSFFLHSMSKKSANKNIRKLPVSEEITVPRKKNCCYYIKKESFLTAVCLLKDKKEMVEFFIMALKHK